MQPGEHDLIDPKEPCHRCDGKGRTESMQYTADGLTYVHETCDACRGRGCQTVRVDE